MAMLTPTFEDLASQTFYALFSKDIGTIEEISGPLHSPSPSAIERKVETLEKKLAILEKKVAKHEILVRRR